MNSRKYLLTLLCFVVSLTVSAQEKAKEKTKDKITLVNDTVYKNGIGQFTVRTRGSKTNTDLALHTFISFDKKIQAMISMKLVNDTIRFSGRFPEILVAYDCLYPKIDLQTILESYINNKIMVNGIAKKEGLELYCNERNLPLRTIVTRTVSKPGQDAKRDSIMAIRTKERMAKQFKFELANKSNKDVNVFLGDTTSSPNRTMRPSEIPFRQGRYEMIKAGETKQLIGFEGEYVCLTDSLHKIYDLHLLKKDLKSLTVKGKATKFD